ncbi:putative purine-cytosine permease [Septoria linicola]|nr:putative purine-cytosine permease [Septoria linicola]
MATLRQRAKKLQVPQPETGTYAIDHFTSPDLVPLTADRRTWRSRDYIAYWSTGSFAIYNYSTGSALIAFGLSGKQALGAGIFSPIVLAALCVLCGWVGGSHHITYNVAARSCWGLRGTYLPILIRVIPGIVWNGIEGWWGAQAVSTCIGTMSLSWANWSHPLAGGTMELKDLIGFIIYNVLYSFVLWLPPEKLDRPFMISFALFTGTVFGILIWAVHHADGTAGPYFAHDYKSDSVLADSVGWAVVYGATAVLGNMGTVTLGNANWCRLASVSNTRSMTVQVVALMICVYSVFAIGIIATSAASQALGETFWQPYVLLREIQRFHNNSSSARAGVFFASAGCAWAQICVNVILNSTAVAMDLQAWAPKWLNIRRGAYIIAAIGIATNPWQLTVNAQTFIAVLNGFGNFYGPCSGILVTDFWIVRKKLIKMDDLYRGNSDSIYWYYKGFNWRAYAAFFIGVVPAMPGYIISVSDLDRSPNSAMKLSRLGFLTGFFISSLIYWLLSAVFPPPGIGLGTKGHDEDELVLPTAYRQDCPTQGKYIMPIDGVVVRDEDGSGSSRDEVRRKMEGKEDMAVEMKVG